MKLVISILIFSIAATMFAPAQNTHVKGFAPGSEGKTVRLTTYSDMLCYQEELLASAMIDSNGFFDLEFTLQGTKIATIYIEYYMAEIYIQAGITIEISTGKLLFNSSTDKINYFLEPMTFVPKITREGSDGLNFNIRKLNVMYNKFLIAHADDISGRITKLAVDTFELAVQDTFSDIDDEYFNDYLTYRLAQLEMTTGRRGGFSLMQTYFYRQAILYDHIEYMSFFNQYFEDYFLPLNRPVTISDLRKPVNVYRSYYALLDTLGRDSMLRNEVFRDLVLIRTLMVLHERTDFSGQAVEEVLAQIAEKSKFSKHKEIAKNVLDHYRRFADGSPAPDFSLKSAEEDTLSLIDLRGKPVLLCFFNTWNIACIDELELLRRLHYQYGESMTFIGICCDREFMTLYHFSREKKYPWKMLHFGNSYELLEKYQVVTFPYFALISKEGSFVYCPATKPSENIEIELQQVLNRQ